MATKSLAPCRTASIRLQFVCAADLSSRLIAWYGNGYGGYSHVDAVLPDGSLLGARSDKVGGKPAGVEIRPPGYEPVTRRAVVRIPVTSAEAAAWEAWLRSQINEPYDSGAIWGFVLGRADHAQGRWICSALQTGALQVIRRLPKLPVPTSQVTPDALLLLAVAIGGEVVESGT